MKKKPNIKPTEEDLKDWQSFIENINSIEDKDAPLDNSIIEKNNEKYKNIFTTGAKNYAKSVYVVTRLRENKELCESRRSFQ